MCQGDFIHRETEAKGIPRPRLNRSCKKRESRKGRDKLIQRWAQWAFAGVASGYCCVMYHYVALVFRCLPPVERVKGRTSGRTNEPANQRTNERDGVLNGVCNRRPSGWLTGGSSVRLSVRLSVRPSVRPSVRQSVRRFVGLSHSKAKQSFSLRLVLLRHVIVVVVVAARPFASSWPRSF